MMSDQGASGSGQIVLDTTGLMHYALADRLDVLGTLLAEFECYSTSIVRNELVEKSKVGGNKRIIPALTLPWLDFESLASLEELQRFVKWTSLVGADEFNRGEASVLQLPKVVVPWQLQMTKKQPE